jgi:hypothetical protein
VKDLSFSHLAVWYYVQHQQEENKSRIEMRQTLIKMLSLAELTI